MNQKVTALNTKLASTAQKTTQTRLETMEITTKLLDSWKAPPFQRPLRANAKVEKLAEQIKREEIVPGILTVGIFRGDAYVLDGQHRLYAFRLSGLEVAYADVRVAHFATMGEMGEEFVTLNSQLVRLRPDDILRGLEGSTPALAIVRKQCPFIGYDMIRRSERAPLLSMSAALRCWRGSETDVPSGTAGSAHHVATTLLDEDAEACASALALLFGAWGRDPEYVRLWGSLNLTVCLWLYRRTVVTLYSPRTTKLTRGQFAKLMMALSASPDYLDWLGGRALRDSDRSPCYSRIKVLIARRYFEEAGQKMILPSPAWSSNSGGRGR